MPHDYLARNDATRAELSDLIARLTPDDLGRSLGDGWTVKAALAHLAYWDRYAASLRRAWAVSGFRADVGFVSDHVNDAGLADWLAVTADAALAEALRAAHEADALAANTPEPLRRAAIDGGMPRALDRSIHRAEHLEQITRALGLT
jgi:hypothetical protein